MTHLPEEWSWIPYCFSLKFFFRAVVGSVCSLFNVNCLPLAIRKLLKDVAGTCYYACATTCSLQERNSQFCLNSGPEATVFARQIKCSQRYSSSQ